MITAESLKDESVIFVRLQQQIYPDADTDIRIRLCFHLLF